MLTYMNTMDHHGFVKDLESRTMWVVFISVGVWIYVVMV